MDSDFEERIIKRLSRKTAPKYNEKRLPATASCRFLLKIKYVKSKKLQPDYTINGNVYQLVIPMDIGKMIPAEDSVRLLNAVMEGWITENCP
ncbi:hypothetical protein [Sporomusa malonica]|uniref:hypothetical protein n=1 Tax=Sporomusa malonica TaxID=112901 RepID=UPI000A06EC5E|nr:hypothetical protein [Sporomusa malonica]